MRKRGFEVVSKYKDKNINLPKRATKGSAGYDIESAEDITIPSIWKTFYSTLFQYFGDKNGTWEEYKQKIVKAIKPILVPTGLKAYMQEDEVLKLHNRSSNPLKRGLILSNGIGIVDSDYYNNKSTEGHIMAQFVNIFPFDIKIKKGERICQGIFEQYLLTDDDTAEGERTGGHGSTNDK